MNTASTTTFQLLDAWLAAQPPEVFPGNTRHNYAKHFDAFASYMFTHVHPEIGVLAQTIDGGLLTAHGPSHIRTVIERASNMVGDPSSVGLAPYEVYLLLVAMHLHDTGNIYGRSGHEQRLAEVISAAGTTLGSDSVEWRLANQIAQAHTGKNQDGSPADTIGNLLEEDENLGQEIRVQALAAILRFADELADDSERASRLGTDTGTIPDSSQIYHAYAKSLYSVKVARSERAVRLKFHFCADTACRQFNKHTKHGVVPVFLLDEIYERTLKLHIERIYCSRFMRQIVALDKVNARIDVYDQPTDIQPVETIEYKLEENGYPSVSTSIDIVAGQPLVTGSHLKAKLEQHGEDNGGK